MDSIMLYVYLFQSTLPMRGATGPLSVSGPGGQHFNPRSPCGERPGPPRYPVPPGEISIHAPHAGSDLPHLGAGKGLGGISIHAPHAGSDAIEMSMNYPDGQFQSTLPMRGATGTASVLAMRAPISIHAPHAGSDRSVAVDRAAGVKFQSTLPMRGATVIIYRQPI